MIKMYICLSNLDSQKSIPIEKLRDWLYTSFVEDPTWLEELTFPTEA